MRYDLFIPLTQKFDKGQQEKQDPCLRIILTKQRIRRRGNQSNFMKYRKERKLEV